MREALPTSRAMVIGISGIEGIPQSQVRTALIPKRLGKWMGIWNNTQRWHAFTNIRVNDSRRQRIQNSAGPRGLYFRASGRNSPGTRKEWRRSSGQDPGVDHRTRWNWRGRFWEKSG